ncbi:hypothetical protein FKW77_000943 [Venturia effusa]|uniref:holo-[acyl-carrier-protein] synthase n=1 Tax=Venturia effusa TaxID=50376 RepID=A0A517LAB7_9PEZI|nr:hypothetical protein FKW77_000943 [Venturia effusa]
MSSVSSTSSRRSSWGESPERDWSPGPSSSSTSVDDTQSEIVRWIIDTRNIWHGNSIQDAAGEYLNYISEGERKAITRKYHIADAKMSLASALLKRAFIARVTGLLWHDIEFTRKGHPVHGKPAWDPPKFNTTGVPWPNVDFNVSHQAGLVTLVGVCVPDGELLPHEEALVGCDIVAPHERSDLEMIQTSDFEDYTSTFDQIFSDSELWDITYNLPSHAVQLYNGQRLSDQELGRLDRVINTDQNCSVTMPDGRIESFPSDLIIDAKLRRFYTFFTLKESYIKLCGEGLLAPWLRELEFRNVSAPTPGTQARCSTSGTWGGKTYGGRPSVDYMTGGFSFASGQEEDLEIWRDGEEVHSVRTEVQSFEEDYMISAMISPPHLVGSRDGFPPWEHCDMERDILFVARMGKLMLS